MPQFDPQLVQVMRNALEEVMTKVPAQDSTLTIKVYLAECNRSRREASMASDRDYVVQSPAGSLASSMAMAGETICD